MRTLLSTAALLADTSTFAQSAFPAATRLAMPGDDQTMLELLIGEWILGRRYIERNPSGQFAGNQSARMSIISPAQ